MDNNIQLFKNKYNEVFDSAGNVKACGRQNCIDLMNLAKSIKNGYYGDDLTGRLNILEVKRLYNSIGGK